MLLSEQLFSLHLSFSYLQPDFGQKTSRSSFFFILMNGFSFINFAHHLYAVHQLYITLVFGIILVFFVERFMLYRVSRNMHINREVLSMQNNHITQDSFNAKIKTKVWF